jgi:CHAT domain-containing protein
MLRFARFVLLALLLLPCVPVSAQDAAISEKLAELKSKNNLADWLYERIEYTNANPQQLPFLLRTQKESWRQPNNIDERVAWLTLLTTEGYDQLQTGDILSSISYYEEAYRYYYKYEVADFDAPEYICKPLSNNYTRLGDYERAVFIQQKSLNNLPAHDVDNIASVYSNMAISYYSMGNYALAERCIAKGEGLVKSPEIRFRLQNILADILYDHSDLAKARVLLTKNIASQKKIDAETAYSRFGAYTTLGRIEIKAGRLSGAEKDLKMALLIISRWFPGDRQREQANITAQLGKVERLRNQPRKALAYFDKALQILRINTAQNKTQVNLIYGENNLVDIFHEKALTYQLLKQDESAVENIRYALLATDKIRTEFADSKTKERLQQDAKGLAEAAIEMAMALYDKTKDRQYLNLVLEIAEQTKARTLADDIQYSNRQIAAGEHDTTMRRVLDLERAIAYNERLAITGNDAEKYRPKISALKYNLSLLNKAYRRPAASNIAHTAEMLMALLGNLRVMEFFFGTHAIYRIDIRNNKVEQAIRISNADTLRQQLIQFIDTYYRNGPAAALNSPKEFYKQSNNIYTALFGHITLKAAEHLCVVADDVLGYLSFDGLITGKKYQPTIQSWPFLVKKITTSYAFSLNTLIKNKPQGSDRSVFTGLFVTHQRNSNTPIVAVKKEADAISKLVKGGYLYDDEVNNKAFFKAFETSAVLHISTHAYLSGANKEPTLDFGKEKLFLFELLTERNKPNLVILSACRTGDGLLAKGEGIISLSRGFSAVGTPATIAGLWNVNDDAVSKITAEMYKQLLAGQTSGEALHNAKLIWLNTAQTSDAMYLPYYWDSLILMGTDAPLHLQKANHFYYLYAIGGLLVVVLLLVAWRRCHR